MFCRLAAIAAVTCFWSVGYSQPDSGDSDTNKSAATSTADDVPTTLNRVPRAVGPSESIYPALRNLLPITDTICSGGEPRGDRAFASLARLGVKTVVSVDGATPDIEAARQYGLRYVHIPIGYDGVEKHAELSLTRLVRDADGPFYVHCHHGRHRAPAAAAIACRATGDIDGQGALKVLERAGTSKSYAGLWRDVEAYQAPRDDAELPALVEVADVGSFAAAMAKIDRAYDNLQRCRVAQWSTPDKQPDLVPAQEVLLLKEGLRESARNLADAFGDEFKTWLTEAELIAQTLEEALNANDAADQVSQHWKGLERSCQQCHEKYRD